MPNGDGINWKLLQEWFEARAEVIADRAADKAVDRGRREMKELLEISSSACPGYRHAQTFARCLWLVVGATVVAIFGAVVAFAKATW